jgi:hypothetical protein
VFLSKNPVFIEECSNFKSQIDQVTDQKAKTQLETLLTNLVAEVKSLDRRHEDLIYSPKMPDSVLDHKSNIGEIRKKIKTMLEDCKKAGLIR